jgi:hypothetical protein
MPAIFRAAVVIAVLASCTFSFAGVAHGKRRPRVLPMQSADLVSEDTEPTFIFGFERRALTGRTFTGGTTTKKPLIRGRIQVDTIVPPASSNRNSADKSISRPAVTSAKPATAEEATVISGVNTAGVVRVEQGYTLKKPQSMEEDFCSLSPSEVDIRGVNTAGRVRPLAVYPASIGVGTISTFSAGKKAVTPMRPDSEAYRRADLARKNARDRVEKSNPDRVPEKFE